MMEGGVQVNTSGVRFANEHAGYSEQAEFVLSQPGGIAFNIYDERLHQLGMAFEDYRNAVNVGAVKSGKDAEELALQFGLPANALAQTLQEIDAAAQRGAVDAFGRGFDVDPSARVLSKDGKPFPNLFAGGGAARGLSGPEAWGYLSGNGLLTAVTLGRAAGLSVSSLD
jgi:fumarate reductase flavoprotein subunit